MPKLFSKNISAVVSTSINNVSKDLLEIRAIASIGATTLALELIDKQQQKLDLKKDQGAWLDWERDRINIYELGKSWQVLQQRVADYDQGLPQGFYYWAKQKQINALLTLKQGSQARHILQSLIWVDKETKAQNQWLPIWQKLIIRSYLVNNETEDALLAAQRYYQDYRNNELADRLLRARILLLNQRNEEVVDLLINDTKHPKGGMLYSLAQLRSRARPAKKVLQSALRQMRGKWASDELKYTLWAVVAESARESRDRPSMVNALEHVVAGNKQVSLPIGLFNFSADTLWDAYIEYALYLGNRDQFLIGNDQQWLDAAKKAKAKYPVKARSLYSMVILRGQNEVTRLKAASGFLALMHKRKRGAELMLKLFTESEYFKNIRQIPVSIRYDLVNVALSRSDIELASSFMSTIQRPPAGANNYQWQLRRARIFILGGKPDEGVETLKAIIDNNETLDRQQLDHFLQVVFDLQTVKVHEPAYQLFITLLPKVADLKLQREIYFWMADSLKAQQNYTEAARLYLRSAIHIEKLGLDPWGQTARYQAAEMLTKADLLQDARSLYEQLLKTTKNPARRAVLKHELQKLWLLKDHDSLKVDITE